ncbi:MAG: sugar ABC transporter permease [Bifidobacteriaceae bacterium]|jgi:arabinogalactan oligomer/maltooligosaccharide transport system permease protein|nr:sugar ABC transporter permease [Bifidobacteriaceae bacterium]
MSSEKQFRDYTAGTARGFTTRTDADRRAAHRKAWWREVGWRHIVAVVVSIYAVFPLVFVVNMAFDPNAGLANQSIFKSFSLQNFSDLFSSRPFGQQLANTLIVGGITAIGTVLMGAAAAYAFSRFRFQGRRFTLTFLLVVQMFPQLLAFVAIYLLVLGLQEVFPVLGMNSLVTVIAIYLGGALGVNTFLMYGFFNTVPVSLDEAAKLDGATHAQIYWTIILRMVAPVLAVVGLLSFISSFSEFVIARLVLTQPEKWTLAVALYDMVGSERHQVWGQFAAGAVISAIPVLVLFLFLQRYIVSGLTAGAVKG